MNLKTALSPMMPKHRIGLVAVAVFVAGVSLAALRTLPLPSVFGVRLTIIPWVEFDFRQAVYCPAATLLAGGSPYDHDQLVATCPDAVRLPLYLPSAFALHAPLALLPYGPASILYFLLTVGLTLAFAWGAFRVNDLRPSATSIFLLAGILILSRPGQWNLLVGQVTLQACLGVYAALYFARSRPVLSGLGLALAFLKPSFGLPLAVLLLARGAWRVILAGGGFGLLFNLPLLALLAARADGVDGLLADISRTHEAWRAEIDPSVLVHGMDLTSLTSRLAGGWLPGGAEFLVAVLVLGTTVIAMQTAERIAAPEAARLSFSLACCGVLLAVHHHTYDLLLLAGPDVSLARRRLAGTLGTGPLRSAALALVAFLSFNYVTTESVLGRLRGHRVAWVALASLNGIALLAVFALFLIPVLLPGRRLAVGRAEGEPVQRPGRLPATTDARDR